MCISDVDSWVSFVRGKMTVLILLLFEQVRNFYTKVLNEEERKRLCENIAGHLKDAQLFIQKKAVSLSLIAEG